jgi:hypothetical protein
MAETGDHINPIIDTNANNVNIELAGEKFSSTYHDSLINSFV